MSAEQELLRLHNLFESRMESFRIVSIRKIEFRAQRRAWLDTRKSMRNLGMEIPERLNPKYRGTER